MQPPRLLWPAMAAVIPSFLRWLWELSSKRVWIFPLWDLGKKSCYITAVMLHLPVTHLTMKWKISHKWWIKRFLPLDLLFLKLPFAVRPGLTDSRVANLIVLSNCTTKMKVEMITVQGSSVKQWVQAQYTGLVSWVIISTWLVEKCGQANIAWSKELAIYRN